MTEKPTYEELEQRVKAFEKEVLQHKLSAEKLLENEQDKYNKLIQDSNDAIIIVQGIELKLANKAAYRMWGYQNEEEMADIEITDVVSPKDLEVVLKRGEARQMGKNVPSRYEFRALHKDGTEFLAEVSVSRILYQGQVARQAVIRDITERKAAVESLRKSEERFRTITNTAMDSIFCKDINQQYTFVNPAMVKLMGCTEADLVGKVPDEIFDKEDAAIVNEVDQRTFSGENISEMRSLTIAGKPYTFHTIQVPLHDSSGDITGISGIVRDITGFKQAEEALSQSEIKYRLLADNVTDVIYIVNLDKLRFEYVSPSVETVSGYTVEEVMDFNIYDLLLPHSADLVMETIANELEKNKYGKAEPKLLELEVVRKDGLNIWMGISARFLRDNEGHVTSGLCVARDISERKKAEEDLKESEEKYRRLMANAKDMIYRQSLPDGKYEYINQASVEITGYTPEEICNEPLHIRKTIHPDWKDYIEDQWEKLLKGELPPYYEFQIVHKSGDVKWIHQRNIIIYDENGQPVATEGIATDITELKQAEEALRKSEKMHRLLAENSKDTIFRQSLPDGGFEYISSAFKSLTGYIPEELYNEPLLMKEIIVHPDSADCFKEQWEKLLDGEISPYYEYKVVSKSGEIKWVNQRSVLIIDNNTKSPIAVEGIISDVTELKKADEKLLREKNSLGEKVEERTTEIQEKSVALKVLLNQRGDDKKKLEEAIMSNVKELLIPNINRLKNSTLTSKQQTSVNVLESNLNEIISPFANSAFPIFMKLTPTEIQVANFIKYGSSSKDIAESLCLSQRTVDTHRYNIRKKIGLRGKGTNLRTYLLSIT